MYTDSKIRRFVIFMRQGAIGTNCGLELSAEMDGGTARRSLLLVSVAALILSSCPGPATASPAAAKQSETPEEEGRLRLDAPSLDIYSNICQLLQHFDQNRPNTLAGWIQLDSQLIYS